MKAIKRVEQKRRQPEGDSGKQEVPEVGGTGEKYLSNMARLDSQNVPVGVSTSQAQ